MPGFNPRTFVAQKHQPALKKVNLGSTGAGLPVLRNNVMKLPQVPRKPKVAVQKPLVQPVAPCKPRVKAKHPPAKVLVKKPAPFKPPSDGVVRAIASCAAKREHRASRTRWDKIIKPYCREMMGYADKGREVEEFLYIRLKQTVDGWRTSNSTMDTHQMALTLEQTVTLLFGEIKRHLIQLAKKGRRVKANSHHENYETVVINLGMKSRREVFIIFKSFADRAPEIVSVKSAREFRKGVSKRFTRRERTRRQREVEEEALDFRFVPYAMRH